MFSYGIPAALFLLIPFSLILIKSFMGIVDFNKSGFSNNIFDKAWLASLLVLTISHLVDITYFDGRISVSGWILFAGARNIIKQE